MPLIFYFYLFENMKGKGKQSLFLLTCTYPKKMESSVPFYLEASPEKRIFIPFAGRLPFSDGA